MFCLGEVKVLSATAHQQSERHTLVLNLVALEQEEESVKISQDLTPHSYNVTFIIHF